MAEHEGTCCECVGELQSEVREAEAEGTALRKDINDVENDLDDAKDMVAMLEATLRDLGPEPDVTYDDVMQACVAGAVRLGVNPMPWAGAFGPAACGALGP